jgi:hypothetical protein
VKSKLRVLNPFRALRVKVTPDPAWSAELERRRSQVSYMPDNGFHRDRVQQRVEKKQ